MTPSEITANLMTYSVNPRDVRIATYLLKYPRFIHAELMTHRAFSRNAASSRAIPIRKMIKSVWSDPAMPVRWGKTGKGMQDHGVLKGWRLRLVRGIWRAAAKLACGVAWLLYLCGLHKQIANRVLEPFAWMETLVTATDFENFFALRVHKDAQPEFQRLAHLMLCEFNSKTPTRLQWGEWHIPFGDRMPNSYVVQTGVVHVSHGLTYMDQLKIATARAARLSYLTMEGEIDVLKDFELHDRLSSSGHWSPFEHCAMARMDGHRYGNFRSWMPYRLQFKNENRSCDLVQLQKDYEASIAA